MWKVFNKEVDLGEPTSFLDHVNLGCTQRQCEISKEIVDNYRTTNFLGGTEKTAMLGKPVGGTILWVSKQNDSTTLQSIVSMHWWPPLQRRRNEIRGRIVTSMFSNCFWNAYTWHELDDLIFYGQWTNLHDPLQNGPHPSTNYLAVWYLTSITHVDTNSIVMWVILPNNADWDCFKTQILQEILRIQNLRQVEPEAFLEVIHLFQSVRCVRNKLKFRTVQQNQKSFLWMQDWGSIISTHLIYGICSLQFLETRIRVIRNGTTC